MRRGDSGTGIPCLDYEEESWNYGGKNSRCNTFTRWYISSIMDFTVWTRKLKTRT